jgi:hypothetical protein
VTRQALPPPGPDSPPPGLWDKAFDPSLAHYPTRRIPIDRVVDLLHQIHRPERVAEYRENMRNGIGFPPIAVIRLAGWYLVADGHKRLQAYLGLQPRAADLMVECWPWQRWLADQRQQFLRKRQQFATALRASPRRRSLLYGLISDTLRHWWRVARSLLTLVASRRTGR